MLGTYEERMRDLRALYPFWTAETIWTRFEKNAERFADQPFILFEDTVRTYRQVKESADQVAASLLLSGVRSGDHVALLMYNCPAAVELIFALAKIGAVRVPIHAAAGSEQAVEIMRHAACVLLITQKPMPPELLDRLPSIRGVVLLCGQEEDPRYMGWETFLALGEGQQVFAAPQDPEDLANKGPLRRPPCGGLCRGRPGRAGGSCRLGGYEPGAHRGRADPGRRPIHRIRTGFSGAEALACPGLSGPGLSGCHDGGRRQ